MILTSSAFKECVKKSSRTFRARFMKNDEPLNCEVKKVVTRKGACTEEFVPGMVYAPYIEAEVLNCIEPIEDEELLLQMGLLLSDGTVEYVNIGYFTVTKPERNEYQTSFQAVGRISSKLNVLPELPTVKSLENLANAITEKTGVQILTKGLAMEGTVNDNLNGRTCKEILEIIACVTGGFATEDGEGNIVICKFTTESLIEYNGDYVVSPPKFYDYDYTVNGVKVVVSLEQEDEDGASVPEKTYTEGSPNLTLSNGLMTEELFQVFARNLIGYTFRPGEMELTLGDPSIEPWDCIHYSDTQGVAYVLPCLNLVHTFDGGFSTTIVAKAKSESESSIDLKGPMQKKIERLNAELFTAKDAIVNRLRADKAELLYAKITELDATNARIDHLVANSITADTLEAKLASLGYLKADVADLKYATVDSLNATYATIDLANVKDGSITTAMIGTGVVDTAQIADGSITDAKIVELTANKITAGTLSVERLEIRGSDASLVYALNNITGALQSQNVDTLNGEILTERTITADKIVANAITANEIASKTITANQIATGAITADKIDTGAVTADKISVGSLEAISAKIGGFTIGEKALHNGTTVLAGAESGVYLGIDGISCGINFLVTNEGKLTASDATVTGVFRNETEGNVVEMFNGGVTAIQDGGSCEILGNYVILSEADTENYYRKTEIGNSSLRMCSVYVNWDIPTTTEVYKFGVAEGGYCNSALLRADVNIYGDLNIGDGEAFGNGDGNLTVAGDIGASRLRIKNTYGLSSIDSTGASYVNIAWVSSTDRLIVGGGSYPPNGIYLNPKDGYSVHVMSSLFTGDKTSISDGTVGTCLSNSGRLHLQTAGTNNPYIGFYKEGSTAYDAYVSYNVSEDELRLGGAPIIRVQQQLAVEGIINAKSNVYMQYDEELRGLKSGQTTASTGNSNILCFIGDTDNGDDGISKNRAVFGAVSNSAATEIRSPSAVFIKCNGIIDESSSAYVLQFARLNFGTSASPSYYGCFRSKSDGSTYLGSGSYRYKGVYATSGTVSTSDRNKKHDIMAINNRDIQLFDMLLPSSYYFNDGDRRHFGFIAQDVEDALNYLGLTSVDFAGLCKDYKMRYSEQLQDDIPALDANGNPIVEYSLRYQEFIALNTAKIKWMEAKYDNEFEVTKAQIAQLHFQIAQLFDIVAKQRKFIDLLMAA